MAKQTNKPQVNFVNQPNMGYIWEVLLNLLSEQEGWDQEFKVTCTLKDEYKTDGEITVG